MIGRVTRLIVALAAVVLLASAFSACGSSGSDTSSGSTSTSSTTTESGGGTGNETARHKEPASSGKGKQQGSEAGGHSHAAAPIAPLHVSGGGSGQFRVKGGDNSIQEFGEESGESELEEAAGALHAFFIARAEEDWHSACAHLSKTVVEELEQLGSRSKAGSKSCPATLAALTPALPPAVKHASTIVDAASLRREGERSFLIYRGAEETPYAIVMAHEDGGWKVGSLAPVPLQ